MKRFELLRQVRGQLNRLAVELVNEDLLEAAQNCIAASMCASETQDKLAEAGADEVDTMADQEPAEGD